MNDEIVTLSHIIVHCSPNITISPPMPLMSTHMTSASESRNGSWTGCNRRVLTWFLADP
jgi:hypothetical protein